MRVIRNGVEPSAADTMHILVMRPNVVRMPSTMWKASKPFVSTSPSRSNAITGPTIRLSPATYLVAWKEQRRTSWSEMRQRALGRSEYDRPGVDKDEIVDRYVLEERLGDGAFGETWRARDPQLDKIVVIKVARARSQERLLREFQAIGRLDSPHLQRVFAVGRTSGDRVYLVYEWIDGATLDTFERLRVEDALAVARAIACGLETAHRAGFVHRDVKPSNVIIPRRGGFAAAKLLDFGLVGYLTERGDGRSLTKVGAIVGTPRYMSPEQVRGQQQAAASDVWALGVVLAELVAGKYPFRESGDFAGIVAAILDGTADLSAIPRQPAGLRELLERCLDKDLARRPRDGGALRRALDAITGVISVTAGVPDPPVQSGEPRPTTVPWTLRVARARAYVARRTEALLTLAFLVAASVALTTLPGATARSTAALSLGTIAMGILAGRLLRIWARQIDATTPAMVVARTRNRMEAGRLLSASMALDVQGLEDWADGRGSPRERELLAMALLRYQESLTAGGFSGLLAALEHLLGCVDQIRPWWVRSSAQLATLITIVVVGLGLAIATRAMLTFH